MQWTSSLDAAQMNIQGNFPLFLLNKLLRVIFAQFDQRFQTCDFV